MSNRNNDVFQVLVTSGNQALLIAGSPVDSLAVGQLGCFDAKTQLSVTTAVREFYFAVGLDRDGDTVQDDIRKSAGQYIQRTGISNYTFKPHSAGRPHILKVGGYKASCDTDYALKVEFRNSRINRIQGTNQFTHTYAVRTGCCDGCASGCDSADANTLTLLMVAEINLGNTPVNVLVAQAVTRQAVTIADHGTSADYASGVAITDADIAVLIAFNALESTADEDKVYTDFIITSQKVVIKPINGGVNLGFHKLLETFLIASLVEGFACESGVVTELQSLVYEQGTGNNIRQQEYNSSGWNEVGPYILANTAVPPAMDYFASATGKYDMFTLEYEISSKSGWLDYENPCSTLICTPEADTTTRNALATLMDLITAEGLFEALADDVSASSTTSTVIEGQPANATKDGIA